MIYYEVTCEGYYVHTVACSYLKSLCILLLYTSEGAGHVYKTTFVNILWGVV